MTDGRMPVPPERILRAAEDRGVNGEVCITEGASQHIRAKLNRLREVEIVAREAVERLEEYATFDRLPPPHNKALRTAEKLRRALHEGDEGG